MRHDKRVRISPENESKSPEQNHTPQSSVCVSVSIFENKFRSQLMTVLSIMKRVDVYFSMGKVDYVLESSLVHIPYYQSGVFWCCCCIRLIHKNRSEREREHLWIIAAHINRHSSFIQNWSSAGFLVERIDTRALFWKTHLLCSLEMVSHFE